MLKESSKAACGPHASPFEHRARHCDPGMSGHDQGQDIQSLPGLLDMPYPLQNSDPQPLLEQWQSAGELTFCYSVTFVYAKSILQSAVKSQAHD